jgi:DNA-directed RNA polymerase subunit RPC12/RpoP
MTTGVWQNKQLRRDLFAENHICPECGRRMVLKFRGKNPPSVLATIDHIVPRASGGSDHRGNLRLICRRCNHEKDSLTLAQHGAKATAKRQATAVVTAVEMADITIDRVHVTLSCAMCEAMGLDPNAKTVEGDETLNWQFLLPAAAVAHGILTPVAPEGDLLAVPAPDGKGWILRIDQDGQLHIREDLKPGTPLFTLVNKQGDVTVAVGPPDLVAMTAANDKEH